MLGEWKKSEISVTIIMYCWVNKSLLLKINVIFNSFLGYLEHGKVEFVF